MPRKSNLIKANAVLSDHNLQAVLWNSLKGVANGTTDYKQGCAIANISREIIRVEKVKLDAMRLDPKKTIMTKLLGK